MANQRRRRALHNHGPCSVCGLVMMKPLPRSSHAYRYCSSQCRAEADQKGKPSRNYRGGKRHSHGYIEVLVGGNEYAKEHRLVMAQCGAHIEGMVVHHINGIRSDNRPENLFVMTNSEHARMHNLGKVVSDTQKEKQSRSMRSIISTYRRSNTGRFIKGARHHGEPK